ncbi:hypothetical protein ACOME3_005380 [Neoechinorhynchus agilis]
MSAFSAGSSTENEEIYHSVCEYAARDTDEISLSEDEPVNILDQGDAAYYLVRSLKQKAKRIGWVPICILEKRIQSTTGDRRLSLESSLTGLSGTDISNRERATIEDLFEGERDYVGELQYFTDTISTAIDSDPNCPTKVKQCKILILSTTKELLKFHRTYLLNDFYHSNHNSQSIARAFLTHSDQFHLYVSYFSDMNLCETTFDKNPEIVNYIDNALLRHGGTPEKPLMYYLTRPIERLEVYREFLKDIVRFTGRLNSDVKSIVWAFGAINNIFNQIRFRDVIATISCLPPEWRSWGDVERQDNVEILENNSWLRKEILIFKGHIVICDVVQFKWDENTKLNYDRAMPLVEIRFIRDNFPDQREFQLSTKDLNVRFRAIKQFTRAAILRRLRLNLNALGLEINGVGIQSVLPIHNVENITTSKRKS